jgi:hypothetical protein
MPVDFQPLILGGAFVGALIVTAVIAQLGKRRSRRGSSASSSLRFSLALTAFPSLCWKIKKTGNLPQPVAQSG